MEIKKLISQSIRELEHKAADRIGKVINVFSIRTRKIGLLIFGLVIGIFCFLLIVGVVGKESSKSVQVDRLTLPRDIYPSDSLNRNSFQLLDSLNTQLKSNK